MFKIPLDGIPVPNVIVFPLFVAVRVIVPVDGADKDVGATCTVTVKELL
jgi:hypothetical protein